MISSSKLKIPDSFPLVIAVAFAGPVEETPVVETPTEEQPVEQPQEAEEALVEEPVEESPVEESIQEEPHMSGSSLILLVAPTCL